VAVVVRVHVVRQLVVQHLFVSCRRTRGGGSGRLCGDYWSAGWRIVRSEPDIRHGDVK
jgi:hypothetical protein